MNDLSAQAFGQTRDRDSWSVAFLAVAEYCQGKGLGKALMHHIEHQVSQSRVDLRATLISVIGSEG